jgi:hypothetical protein
MAEAIASGNYDLPRREGSVHITPLPGVMATNMTRVAGIDPTDPEQLTAAEIEGRRQAVEYARFLREMVPGYERSRLSGLSHQIGVREARRVYGQYRLDRDDVLGARQFDDAIAQCGAPIEAHHASADTRWEYVPGSQTYGIPYRCLVPLEIDGLLVAGRVSPRPSTLMPPCEAWDSAWLWARRPAQRRLCAPRLTPSHVI